MSVCLFCLIVSGGVWHIRPKWEYHPSRWFRVTPEIPAGCDYDKVATRFIVNCSVFYWIPLRSINFLLQSAASPMAVLLCVFGWTFLCSVARNVLRWIVTSPCGPNGLRALDASGLDYCNAIFAGCEQIMATCADRCGGNTPYLHRATTSPGRASPWAISPAVDFRTLY